MTTQNKTDYEETIFECEIEDDVPPPAVNKQEESNKIPKKELTENQMASSMASSMALKSRRNQLKAIAKERLQIIRDNQRKPDLI